MSKGSHPPPVPEKNVSPKGPGDTPQVDRDTGKSQSGRQNLAEQGRQGNIKQNTTNQGYQQDR